MAFSCRASSAAHTGAGVWCYDNTGGDIHLSILQVAQAATRDLPIPALLITGA